MRKREGKEGRKRKEKKREKKNSERAFLAERKPEASESTQGQSRSSQWTLDSLTAFGP